MNRALYTAATGMNAMQNRIDVTSNNIANVNTTGFKQDRAEFQDLMYERLNYTRGKTSEISTNPTGIDVGLGVRISGIQKNFTQGTLTTTGNELDLSIQGKGFFQIELPNGETGYTRNGAFKINNEGSLVNSEGYLLQPEITIPNNYSNVSIGIDGIVTATNSDTNQEEQIGQIEIANFINPAGLTPKGDSLFMANETSGDAITGNPNDEGLGMLRQGMLEGSNVQLVKEMVNLITAQRAYEANSKAITTTDEMLQAINQLK